MQKLIDWSREHYAQLPWREQRGLYQTLVSEVMLQQTTVGTVLKRFPPFMQKFPSLKSLAQASEEEVVVAWKGLGYYRRAKNLRLAARAIQEHFGGSIPTEVALLKSIPGIGEYTANALRTIGANRPGLAIDANLERVLARLWNLEEVKGPALHRAIQARFPSSPLKKSMDHWGYRSVHEALMDLGRVLCQANRADCPLCPLKRSCKAYQLQRVMEIPHRPTTPSKKHELHLLRVHITRRGQLAVYQKPPHQWVAGQFEVPTFILQSSDPQLQQYPQANWTPLESLPVFKTTITKYKIHNYIWSTTLGEAQRVLPPFQYQWKDLDDEKVNWATSTLKLLKAADSARGSSRASLSSTAL